MITDIAQALRLAETAGRVMLENGAETYRAEDTVIHVCRSMGLPDVQVLVIPTGILCSSSRRWISCRFSSCRAAASLSSCWAASPL